MPTQCSIKHLIITLWYYSSNVLFTFITTDILSIKRPCPDPNIWMWLQRKHPARIADKPFLPHLLRFIHILPIDVFQGIIPIYTPKRIHPTKIPLCRCCPSTLQWPSMNTYVPLCTRLSVRLSEITPTWKPELSCRKSFFPFYIGSISQYLNISFS